MSDTIELLSAIGQNAALRYASAEELAHTLEQADASEAFKAAVISGNSSRLSEELGQKPMHVDHNTQIPGHEEDEPNHDDDHDDDEPHHSPKPDHDKPSPRR
ncbi:MAG TPA: hypothetical protein VNZ27_14780 [Rhodanobacter sp.]|jgi:hypothetical protein|nr:hypothetical protein [Rhodanobacter sp.]